MKRLVDHWPKGNIRGKMKAVFADKGYGGKPMAAWVKKTVGAAMVIGQNLTAVLKRFVPDKTRRVVERSFAWARDYRRLTEDVERHIRNSVTMIRLAFIRIMLRRLAPSVRTWA
nr:transposase [Azospirillum sp. B4]